MSELEQLALKLATAWHEMQRNTDFLSTGILPQRDQEFTQIRIEQLADLMDMHKEKVFSIINLKN
jgi:hypothetical protein